MLILSLEFHRIKPIVFYKPYYRLLTKHKYINFVNNSLIYKSGKNLIRRANCVKIKGNSKCFRNNYSELNLKLGK